MTVSFTTWINALETLAPTGVTTKITNGPPRELSAAQLPAQWCEVPTGDERCAAAGAEGGDCTLQCDLVVALEPVKKDSPTADFPTCVTMLDSIHAALRAFVSPLLGPMRWRSRLAVVTVGPSQYWVVVTSIEGQG
jgi:hypothetical protein